MSVDPAPPVAHDVFGAQLGLATRYAELLAGDGMARGLLGPREEARIWTRHLVNSAAVTELLPPGARVVDVGSGAGLPGIAMAIRRPDLALDLVEPLLRRSEFLAEAVSSLGIGDRVRVHRGRAEEETIRSAVGRVQWVVARAVAPLDRLARWCLPLLAPGGQLLAIKGATAATEVAEHGRALSGIGAGGVDVVICGPAVEPVTVVRIRRSGTGRQERG